MSRNWSNREIVILQEELHKARNTFYKPQSQNPKDIIESSPEIGNIRRTLASKDIEKSAKQILTRASSNLQRVFRKHDPKKNAFYRILPQKEGDFPTLKLLEKEKDLVLKYVDSETARSIDFEETVINIKERITEESTNPQQDLFEIQEEKSIEFLKEKIVQILTKEKILENKKTGKKETLFKKKTSTKKFEHRSIAFKTMTKKPIKDIIASKIVAKAQIDALNRLRAKTGGINDPQTIRVHDKHGFEDCSGTGNGKTYSAEERFRKSANKHPRPLARLFMAPLKNQLEQSDDFKDRLLKDGLHILPILAMEDLTNPEFKDWVYYSTNKRALTNEKRYTIWEEVIKNNNTSVLPRIHGELKRLNQVVNQIGYLTKERIPKIKEENKRGSIELQEAIRELERAKSRAVNMLTNIALDIVNTPNKDVKTLVTKNPITTYNLSNTASLEEILLDIVLRVFPLEYCKYKSCNYLLTVHKGTTKLAYLKQDKTGVYKKEATTYNYLIGKKEELKEEDRVEKLVKVLEDPSKEGDCIKDMLLKEDFDSQFKTTDFLLSIDECHESYNIINKDNCKTLIDHKNSITDIFGALSNELSKKEKKNKNNPKEQDVKYLYEFKENIEKVYRNNCKLFLYFL